MFPMSKSSVATSDGKPKSRDHAGNMAKSAKIILSLGSTIRPFLYFNVSKRAETTQPVDMVLQKYHSYGDAGY